MKTIGQRIKERREQLGLSQTDLAHKLGLTSKTTISKLENDSHNNITADRIARIAKALDCTSSYLMGWSPEASEVIDRIGDKLTSLSGGYDVFKNEHTKDKEFMEHIELLYSLPKDRRYKVYDYIKYQYYRSDEDAKKKESPLDA